MAVPAKGKSANLTQYSTMYKSNLPAIEQLTAILYDTIHPLATAMAPTPKHVLLPSYSCLVTSSLSCGLVSVETSSACGCCWSATRPEEMSSTGFILQGHVEKYMAATIYCWIWWNFQDVVLSIL